MDRAVAEWAAPLQAAGVAALTMPESYYQGLAEGYKRRRDVVLQMLERHGFRCVVPRGAYYIMADVKAFGFADDLTFAPGCRGVRTP